jgi:hypothetical protein
VGVSSLSALARALLKCGTVFAFIAPVTVHTVVLGWGCVSAVVIDGLPAADTGDSSAYHSLSFISAPTREARDDTLHTANRAC